MTSSNQDIAYPIVIRWRLRVPAALAMLVPGAGLLAGVGWILVQNGISSPGFKAFFLAVMAVACGLIAWRTWHGSATFYEDRLELFHRSYGRKIAWRADLLGIRGPRGEDLHPRLMLADDREMDFPRYLLRSKRTPDWFAALPNLDAEDRKRRRAR